MSAPPVPASDHSNTHLKTYLVGGVVRDALMRLPQSADRDWVVVGSSPQAMLDLGFKPVGADFPVFLHPKTHEEYALARTERKTAKGYHGFSFHAEPSVTLEEDLARRDLTMNAIAQDGDTLIDPFGGAKDIQNKVLRHVSGAFAEDPVRILRVARFAARFEGFSVAPQTLSLMQDMVAAGEVNALVAERVWQELSRALMSNKPSRFFEVLRACGALKVLLPEFDTLWGVPQRAEYHPEIDTGIHAMMVLDMAAHLNAALTVRVACLFHDLGKGNTPADVLPRHIGHEERSVKLLRQVCARWKLPAVMRELSEIVAREHGNIHRSESLNAAAVLRLLERCDAIRRPERFAEVLQACECDARGRLGFETTPYPQALRLKNALQAAQSVDAGAIASEVKIAGLPDIQISKRVAKARESAIHLVC